MKRITSNEIKWANSKVTRMNQKNCKPYSRENIKDTYSAFKLLIKSQFCQWGYYIRLHLDKIKLSDYSTIKLFDIKIIEILWRFNILRKKRDLFDKWLLKQIIIGEQLLGNYFLLIQHFKQFLYSLWSRTLLI
jgi:hypothetical protein